MKEAGVEYDLTEEDSKAKDFTDLLKYSSEKITKALTAQIDELKTKSGQGNDEKIKEYEAELNKAKLRFSEEAELKSKVMKEYDEFKAKSAGEFKNYKKTIELSEIQKRALKFASSVKPLEQTGFLSYFNEKYDFDYNDEGHILPVDKKTGAFIPNPIFPEVPLIVRPFAKAPPAPIPTSLFAPWARIVRLSSPAEANPIQP